MKPPSTIPESLTQLQYQNQEAGVLPAGVPLPENTGDSGKPPLPPTLTAICA